MRKNKWFSVFGASVVFLLALAGCGENKTIYEDGSTSPTTPTTPTPPTDPAPVLDGEAQFKESCIACHSAASVAKTTLDIIKAKSMAMGLTDAQLQKVVDYLATK